MSPATPVALSPGYKRPLPQYRFTNSHTAGKRSELAVLGIRFLKCEIMSLWALFPSPEPLHQHPTRLRHYVEYSYHIMYEIHRVGTKSLKYIAPSLMAGHSEIFSPLSVVSSRRKSRSWLLGIFHCNLNYSPPKPNYPLVSILRKEFPHLLIQPLRILHIPGRPSRPMPPNARKHI